MNRSTVFNHKSFAMMKWREARVKRLRALCVQGAGRELRAISMTYPTVTVVDVVGYPRGSGRAPPRASAMWSALRRVSAEKVRVPLVQPAVGNVGEPTTNRFSWSWVRP
jgi:hypothetical protein